MPGRILVVDDILPNIKLLEAKLTSEYYDVISAENGPTALELARSESPDLILLDVMMPGMDGFKVCEKLKEDPATAHIPVIMVTALSDTADRVRGLQAGADDFLSKPVRDVPLFARVRSLIRLKNLMDAWRVREETSSRLGLAAPAPVMSQEVATEGRILVVEESAIDAENIVNILKSDRHSIASIHNTEGAIAAVNSNVFDLAIISLTLMEGDALRLCSQIRSHVNESVRSLPILLLAEDEEDIGKIAKALDLGVNDYVMRPIERQELQARVRTQIRRRRYQTRLRMNFEESIALASTDALTGVYNRRYLDVHLDQMVRNANDVRKPLSVAFCDIDHFKRLNDTYGHAAGDEVLIEFANRMRRSLRHFDMIARIGGEEFVVVMPDTNIDVAIKVSERLRTRMQDDPFTVAAAGELPVTISIGVSVSELGETSGSDLLRRADEAMYRAKQAGRNRVEASMPVA
ncbi:response regulator PleD [Elstera litoralis]|uniref:diguanylate cyclase n=1 Tax=Elstera litoralis TaxID=552518 RepID=A0A0F3IUK3_9PROT|nr:PleD family two-component system response regulator [Elstera litoralis]KJV10425.1 response regulator PleD [Elstera litoralis]